MKTAEVAVSTVMRDTPNSQKGSPPTPTNATRQAHTLVVSASAHLVLQCTLCEQSAFLLSPSVLLAFRLLLFFLALFRH